LRKSQKVSIRFRQSAYRLLKNSKFNPAYVFAELIDNSLQSYLDNEAELKKINKEYSLNITISKVEGKIIIADNAAGISDSKIGTALEPGNLPENRDGLNEFGIGLKNASVWLSNFYSLKTSAIGEDYSKSIDFDYKKVIEDDIEEIDEKIEAEDINKSYTIITLSKLRTDENKYNYDEIGKQIASIYRGLLISKEVRINFMGVQLSYKQPKVLKSAYYPDLLKFKKGLLKEKPKTFEWIYNFDITMPNTFPEKRMFGFVAILDKIQKHANGVSYCRRRRVIEGAGDEKIYPPAICSKEASSHQRKRMFGEFNFEGFEVSFDKGKLLAESEVDELIDLLAIQIKNFKPKGSKISYNMLKQASELRVDADVDEDEMILKLQKRHKKDLLKGLEEKEKKKFNRVFSRDLKKTVIPRPKIPVIEKKSIEKIIPGLNNENYLLRYTLIKVETSDSLFEINIRNVNARGEKELRDKGIIKVIEGSINVACSFLNRNDFLLKGKSFDGFTEFMECLMISEAICEMKGFEKAHYLRDTFNDLVNL
jgi:hypothetical protein